MPAGNVLHEADALALDGVGQNDRRLAHGRARLLQRFHHLLHVMTIAAQHFPPEGTVFLVERLDVHDVLNAAVNLQPVLVHDADQVIELVAYGLHGGFPDGAFLLLAITHDAEHLVGLAGELARERRADGHAQALSASPTTLPPKDAAKTALDKGQTKYTPTPCLPELREAIAKKFNVENGLPYKPDQITTGAGGKHCLYMAFMAVLNPGDEVIIPAPYWVSYPEQVKLAGGVCKFVRGEESAGFKITPAQLAAAITPKTQGADHQQPQQSRRACVYAGRAESPGGGGRRSIRNWSSSRMRFTRSWFTTA